MVGLYTVDLLAVVMTILTSVDTIAGEITSGTIHAIATKPLARWQILMGKWIGFAGMVAVYVAIMFGGTVAVGYWIGGVMPQHPVRGALLIFLECLLALVGHASCSARGFPRSPTASSFSVCWAWRSWAAGSSR